MTRGVSMAGVAVAAALAAVSPAAACFMEIGLNGGLYVSHPATIPVIVNTRAAVDEGRVRDLRGLPERERERILEAVYAAGQTLALHATRMQMAGPRYSTLFIQSRLWTEYDNGPLAGRFHAGPADPGETVLVIDDGVVSEIMTGRLGVAQATDAGLILARGPEAHAAAEHFAHLLRSYLDSDHGKLAAAKLAVIAR